MRQKNKYFFIVVIASTLGLFIGLVAGVLVIPTMYTDNAAGSNTLLSPLPTGQAGDEINEVMPADIIATPSATPEIEATPVTPKPVFMPRASYEGKASIYSRAGCLGCSPTLTMANGQPLDDNALTVAFNLEPLGTKLEITNTVTGKSVIAEVTDTGGFHRHGRIVDVVPAVADALELKTDQVVSIEVLK